MKVVQVSWRNIAPSAEDPDHDVYIFSIDADSATPFWFEQSIRGGHAERGGCSMLALHELEGWPGGWRADVTKAGCAWVIPLLEEALRSGDARTAIDAILARVNAPV
ncbi:hypothetical protein [Xanthomonas hortorum]|uniref:Uncharacterized protein n=1 Tax=Xanthomonas hortorum pv. pelargonii TaxID=453602 RepID=A0A6V7DU63_9XANT|nr:hypothetical protein [Xanthomonas hortorum]MCE4353533.1 hypothetical protein [Xanthomonas hortorum pv. pelargonii]MCM5522852.1 hypothetical protein [Xanthomonas hortorum pv. pelargonii]MCM5534689.1 hypothetical protein [Xanthomonas hortorum pv. pelargonii]MCM5538807.1 hypothetical protein [Xanthomonas hortorum pv. pelargonii]MCM5543847.1 hypothetical protein [Xanthomonas hortorum pv. pelargonii]